MDYSVRRGVLTNVQTLHIQLKEREIYLRQVEEILEKYHLTEALVLEALLDYVEHTDNLELYCELWEVLHGYNDVCNIGK